MNYNAPSIRRVFRERVGAATRKKRHVLVRQFLVKSDSASRKRPFSTGHFFDLNFLVLLLVVSRVDFIVFVLFLEAVGVEEALLYSSRNRLGALCFALSPRATAR